MFFSQIGHYALRIMIVLAHQDRGVRMRAKDLAPLTHVPPAYVSKVLRRLTEAGLLDSQKGHHGGFALAMHPNKIRLLDILSAVDAYPTGSECVFGWGRCSSVQPCPLHWSWTELSVAVQGWAVTTTLSDVVERDPFSAEGLERLARRR